MYPPLSRVRGSKSVAEPRGNAPRGNVKPLTACAESRCGCGWSRNHSSPIQCRAASRVDLVVRHMTQHLTQPLRIAALSAIAGVSTSHFFALFRSVTGFSPIDFFIRLRMEHACRLLREQGLSVKETAAVLGYDDPFYFSRLFKQVVGIAPSKVPKSPLRSPQVPAEATVVRTRVLATPPAATSQRAPALRSGSSRRKQFQFSP